MRIDLNLIIKTNIWIRSGDSSQESPHNPEFIPVPFICAKISILMKVQNTHKSYDNSTTGIKSGKRLFSFLKYPIFTSKSIKEKQLPFQNRINVNTYCEESLLK